MGLDNNIILKVKGEFDINNLPPYVKLEADSNVGLFHVCYWRKCFGLRNKITWAIDMDPEEDSWKELLISDINEIIDIIDGYLKNPDSWGDSIWDFEDIMGILAQDIVNLGWLKKYLREHMEDEAYFYDSY